MKKIKLQFNKIEKKKVGWLGKKIDIQPIINNESRLYICKEIERCFNERMAEKEDSIPLNLGLSADLDVLICSLQTNADLDNVSYEDMVLSGFINFVKDNIINYSEVKKDVDGLITILTIKSLIPDLNNVFTEVNVFDNIKDKSPEEIQKLIDILKKGE